LISFLSVAGLRESNPSRRYGSSTFGRGGGFDLFGEEEDEDAYSEVVHDDRIIGFNCTGCFNVAKLFCLVIDGIDLFEGDINAAHGYIILLPTRRIEITILVCDCD